MKVVKIQKEVIEPDLTIVQELEERLLEAKEGKIQSLALVYLDEDGTNLSFYACEDDDTLKLYGAFVLACDQFKNDLLLDNEHQEEED